MHVDPQTCYVVELIMLPSAVMKDSNIWSTQGWLRPAEYPVVLKCSATRKAIFRLYGEIWPCGNKLLSL